GRVRPAPPAPPASLSPAIEVEFDEFDVPPAPAAQPIAAPVAFESFGEPGEGPAPLPQPASPWVDASGARLTPPGPADSGFGVLAPELRSVIEVKMPRATSEPARPARPAVPVECCSLLGLCFLEKGMPQLAIKWYGKGLATPGIRETDTAGLLYDLAKVYQDTGDMNLAYSTFLEVYGINTNYRDVVERVRDLEEARKNSRESVH